MAEVVYTIEGTTKDGKKVELTVKLKKFCRCKPSHPNCQKDAEPILEKKVKKLLSEIESKDLFWLENRVNPNFFVKVMEAVTEAMETVCITTRSDHLQGAEVLVKEIT